MKKTTRWLIVGISALAAGIIAAVYLVHRVDSGIAASVAHKSAKTANATIVRVESMPNGVDPSKRDESNREYRVCFVIDDFDQVDPDMRKRYQNAEGHRLAEKGPWCELTNEDGLASGLQVGDKLQVVYLLENEYQIDVERVMFRGKTF